MNLMSEEKSNDLLFRDRQMIVKIDGIWRQCSGRYVAPLEDPWTVRIILNGRVHIIANNFLDFDGFKTIEIENEVITRNIQSLPPAASKKKMYKPIRDMSGRSWQFQTRPDGMPEPIPYNAPQVAIECPYNPDVSAL